jgi:serine/threonine protein kinase
VDKRGNIWAFGVLLYEMVTGCPPKRSVSIPAGIRTTEPNSTGTTTSSAASVFVKWKACRRRGPSAPMSPHIAKTNAK